MKIWENRIVDRKARLEERDPRRLSIDSPVVISLMGLVPTTRRLSEQDVANGPLRAFAEKTAAFIEFQPAWLGGEERERIPKWLSIVAGFFSAENTPEAAIEVQKRLRLLALSTDSPENNFANALRLNDDPDAFFSDEARDIVEAIFIPLMLRDGRRLPPSVVRKNFSNVIFFSLSSGGALGKELENALDFKMAALGYGTAERGAALEKITHLAIGNVVRTKGIENRFTTIYIEGVGDLMASAFNIYRTPPPEGHNGFSIERVSANSIKLWADVPSEITLGKKSDNGAFALRPVHDVTRHNLAAYSAHGIGRPDSNILPCMIEYILRNMAAGTFARVIDLLQPAPALFEHEGICAIGNRGAKTVIDRLTAAYRMAPDEEYTSFPEYKAIKALYGDLAAKRSRVPFMNHIHEGVRILQLIGASDDTIRGFCLHPIVQVDRDLKANFAMARDHNPYSVMLAMEYRNIANQYLRFRTPVPATMAEIAASPLLEINQMLVADKIQNFKDFMRYHRATHAHSDELYQYFKNWFDKLGIPDDVFQALVSDSTTLPEDLIAKVRVNLNNSTTPIQLILPAAATAPGHAPS